MTATFGMHTPALVLGSLAYLLVYAILLGIHYTSSHPPTRQSSPVYHRQIAPRYTIITTPLHKNLTHHGFVNSVGAYMDDRGAAYIIRCWPGHCDLALEEPVARSMVSQVENRIAAISKKAETVDRIAVPE